MEAKERFIPTHAVHPFEILLDELEAMGMRQEDLARRIGMDGFDFSRMMKEGYSVTADLALALERETGIPHADWLAYQEEYIKDIQRIASRVW